MTKLRAEGKTFVVLENGWADSWSFVCVINPKIRVPEGEAGLEFMRNFIRQNKISLRAPAPLWRRQTQPFQKGFVGFLNYDLGEKWMLGKLQATSYKLQAIPEAHFVYTDEVFGFQKPEARSQKSESEKKRNLKIKSNLSRREYLEKIRAIKKYLYDGETYQVNFSQKFSTPYRGDVLNLYKKMTEINPSPFQFFMEGPAGLNNWAVISNSPERLFRIRGQRSEVRGQKDKKIIETRPIKGTAPRGKTAQEDKKNIARMLASAKEKAELEMIVDLERNDLGKICKPGTVEVNENRIVEKYSHVFHTVSNVRGVLCDECDFLDALHALFPGGSVTGCPKKRTMEIIRRLEGEPRGIYCGSAGFIDLSGECDFNIMIRTLRLDKKHKKRKILFRSGGGIVVDSDAQKEYEETLHKSKALISAIL
ncbi:anthranilate synthase component I family protein [Candidatus Peregrinibacteria bacterium]|nr:anthranilate synthase component I family protein [Candidatus Peregrinibacteria bacterium]